ncbi:bifunctional folylpolyglutamate synthase/dihydrofolate synthase [Hasllibacter halocynthiae]|nr:folylpolyglutamate synthase/dihydrofolate synthase family protein [Hasllibacter halocynthiae]
MRLHPKVIDLSLDRMRRILAALGHPERALPPVVHVAGTNGKGSTLAMIRAGLEGAGRRGHAYTSPHLARFHERIRLAGELIPEDDLLAVLEECEEANGGAPITYFEITTAAAMLAMSRVPADHALLEVGLGGRLDATNVIHPELTVITPVDLDHQHFLGDTLERIAGEKAGIVKRGVPLVMARQKDEAAEVIEGVAVRLGAPLRAEGQHWHVAREGGRLTFQDGRGLLDLPLPTLPGPHQVANAGTALAALRLLLPDAPSDDPAFAAAMAPDWPARMQRLTWGPLADLVPGELWLDGGHNPAAGEAVAATLAAMPKAPTRAVVGMLATKDVGGYLSHLAPHLEGLTAIPVPGEGATLPPGAVVDAARAAGIEADAAKTPEDAIRAHPAPRILICGSLYLAGHVLRSNG